MQGDRHVVRFLATARWPAATAAMWQSRSVDPILSLCQLSNEVEPATTLCLCLDYQFFESPTP